MVGWLFGKLLVYLRGWLVGWLVRVFGWLVGLVWLVGSLVGWLVSWFTCLFGLLVVCLLLACLVVCFAPNWLIKLDLLDLLRLLFGRSLAWTQLDLAGVANSLTLVFE